MSISVCFSSPFQFISSIFPSYPDSPHCTHLVSVMVHVFLSSFFPSNEPFSFVGTASFFHPFALFSSAFSFSCSLLHCFTRFLVPCHPLLIYCITATIKRVCAHITVTQIGNVPAPVASSFSARTIFTYI